ncbi:MAG: biotin--[acetyl-CoA-carboxylase] ligase [Salinivirgaceae bacterium]|nr:biotin--[acetyl-CoA-carboxylase] ligase [Salinivirgaceae bacterium]
MNGFKIVELDEVDSTNDYLKLLAEKNELPEGYTVITTEQTSGRGQQGNVWESEPGKNLSISILLRPDFLPANQMFMLSKVVAIAIIDYLNSLGKEFLIKWPNDIYFEDQKISGTLIENQFVGNKIAYSIVGIGLNVNQQIFISDAPNPVSLYNIFDHEFDRDEVLRKLLNQIEVWYQMLADGWYNKINEIYFSHLYRCVGFHDFTTANGVLRAQIEDVEPNGRLVLRDIDGNISKYYFKEVAFNI